jgi:tRNA (pseudouridine54-N1)-methyltransferase
MRQFIVVARDAPTTAEFSLDALPEAGRMDLLARCVTASLLLSHGIREDVRAHLILDDEYTVRFDGSELRGLHPDERSTAASIRTALAEREEAIGHIPAEVSAGVSIVRMGLEETLESLGDESTVYRLHSDGDSKAELQPAANAVFVLSNHNSLAEADAEVVAQYADRRVSLGPEAVHADHAIAVANNWIDLAGGE